MENGRPGHHKKLAGVMDGENVFLPIGLKVGFGIYGRRGGD
jgi:hypothetical protein